MRVQGIISAAVLASLVGIATPVYSQQDNRGDTRSHADQRHDRNRHRQPRSNSRAQRRLEQQRVRHGAWQEHRARTWESDHQTWRDRGGYQGYRVPDDRYRRYFGAEHGFRIQTRPFRVASGHPAFQYRGYWFTVVDRWPESWTDNWYDTDDVYVTYRDDGYYLFNRRHPRAGIAIQISL